MYDDKKKSESSISKLTSPSFKIRQPRYNLKQKRKKKNVLNQRNNK